MGRKTRERGLFHHRRVLQGAGALALVSILGVWWSGQGANDRARVVVSHLVPSPVDSLTLAWRVDDRCAYRLSVDADLTLNPNGGMPRVVKYGLGGLLCARVLETGEGTARVGFQLRNVLHELAGVRDAQRQAALGVPFVVHFEGGMPTTLEFPAGLDAEVETELSELVRTFQVSLPPSPSLEWSAAEEHENGRYRAAYRVVPGGAWSKRKVVYLPGVEAADEVGVERVRVFNSWATLMPAADASWWKRAEVSDDLQLSLAGAPFVRVKKHSILTALPDGFDPTSDLARLGDAESLLGVPVPAYERNGGSRAPVQVTPRVARPEDRERFLELLAAFTGDGGEHFADVHGLAAVLEEFPELAAELPPRLADPALASRVAEGLIHALELAGNAPCQAALSEVCAGSAYPQANRLRAIIGLSGVEDPTPASVAALWQLSAASGTDDMQDLGNTALLALGSLGQRLRGTDLERSADLSSGLQARLAAAVAPESRAVVLTAMANARDPALLPAAAGELEASEPTVRAAAVQALATMDQPAALDALFGRLEHEENSRVRAALVDGMGKLSHKSDSAFAACANMVRSEKDKQVRAALARYLMDNVERYPAGRATLEELVRDRSNTAEIRGYLTKNLYQTARGTSAEPGPRPEMIPRR